MMELEKFSGIFYSVKGYIYKRIYIYILCSKANLGI